MVSVGGAVRAQNGPPAAPVQYAVRGPEFFMVTGGSGERVDARNAASMRQRIVLRLQNATIPDALTVIAEQSGLQFAYRRELLPASARVSLRADDITVAGALTVVLLDANCDVQLAPSGLVSLVPRALARGQRPRLTQGGSTVGGRVVDAVTRAPLDQVAVRIEGPGLGAITASDGRYTIRDIGPGTYRITARRVGYTPLTQTLTLAGDSATTVDFALAAAATKLNEVVTTAIGDQRRYEVGNTISTINADSIAPTAPITSLTDLVSARAPGVAVLETSGMTGAGEAIRIRGLSSLVLQNDPILIVDGVRQDNAAGGDVGTFFGNYESQPAPTRLNDIDFTDIESIDILKGPAASTEYGTDAANGVIVITTKHGTAGRPRWTVAAEQTASAIPERFPDGYYSWGHTTDGTNTAVDCPLVAGEGISAGFARTASNCVVDSVTRWNPLNHAATSMFGTGSRAKYNMSVSGGSAAVLYFVAGALSNETGVLRMPPALRLLADTAKVGLPGFALNPNGEQQRSVRANTAITLGPTASLTATGSYLSTYQQTADATNLFAVYGAPAFRDAAHYYGYDWFGSGAFLTPLAELTARGSQNTDRVVGGLTGTWQPTGWFLGHATVGLDHGSQRNEQLNYPLANTVYQNYNSSLGLATATTDVYSVDLRASATAVPVREVRAVTSGGLQLADTRTAGQSALSVGISATNLTLNGATGAKVTQFATRQATLGGYGEEQLSFAGRLFLTGALRVDAGSNFGRAYATAAYPKASISWLAVDRGATTVRLRGAFGESGVQPLNGAALRLYTLQVGYLGGGPVSTGALNWLGNPNLRPERSMEFEGGVDLTGWANRVTLELTGYSKTTRDALVNVSLSGSTCCYTYQENIGKVRNTGVEGSATATIAQSRSVTWDVGANVSVNHNTLVSLAPGVAGQMVAGGAGFVTYRQTPGYPLYGIWAQRVTYADANHDGIIDASEATTADSVTYVGPSLPTREVSASTHLAVWRGAVTVGGLVDYRGGYRVANTVPLYADLLANSRQTNDPTAPFWLQARAVENTVHCCFNALDAENGSFVRIREVSATYALPLRLVRTLRVQSLSVTGAVRNLALWTRYTGIDPEVSNPLGSTLQAAPTSGGFTVNNDIRSDAGAVPLLRYWVLRLNAGF